MTEELMVWHYTSRSFADEIEDRGELLPMNSQGNYTCALLWFSAQQKWEYMTAKLGDIGLFYSGRRTPYQQLAYEHEAVRYGLPMADPRLLNWRATCQAAGINRQERKHREKIARQNQSDATKWYTTTCEVQLSDLRFQFWWDGEWTD